MRPNERMSPLEMIIHADNETTRKRRLATTFIGGPVSIGGSLAMIDGVTTKLASPLLDLHLGELHLEEWQTGAGLAAVGLLIIALGRIPSNRHKRAFR